MTGSGLRGVAAEVTTLMAPCYRPPPFNLTEGEIAEYSIDLERQLGHEDLRATTAWGADRLIGVAYGFHGPERIPDAGEFYGPVVSALGRPRVDRLLSGRPFEVVQVMVEPSTQRLGVGRDLLERLVTDVARAWLVTLPDSPASRLYRSAGWQPLQPSFSRWGREHEIWGRGI